MIAELEVEREAAMVSVFWHWQLYFELLHEISWGGGYMISLLQCSLG